MPPSEPPHTITAEWRVLPGGVKYRPTKPTLAIASTCSLTPRAGQELRRADPAPASGGDF
jgi:hypothetical protein